MPREIKTTIAVDGEAAFKRAINDANTSMRNLGTQLTLAQAQFKKDGDAMKLMETRSKALKSEIDQQEKIVTALEKAVKDSADAFGENSQKTEKWEAELNRAKAKLANLQSELTLNDAGLDRNGKSFDESSQKAADYQATLQTIGKNVSFQTVTEGIGGITSKLEAAAKKVWNFAKDLRDAMADSAGWADELITDSVKYGMSTDELQQWQYASKLVDTEVETIFNARQKLTNKMSGWKSDYSDNVWETLGINLVDDEGIAKDKMDLMWELGEKLADVSEEYERGASKLDPEKLSMEAFGKSWRDLLPLFTAGRDAFEGYMKEAPIVAEESVKALGEHQDALDKLNSSWEALQMELFATIAPTMTEVTKALSGLLNQFNDWLKTEDGKEAMKGLSDALAELFSGVKDIKFSDAINTAKDAVNALKDGLQWLAGHKENIFGALKVIAGGFGLLKVSETVLKFLQIKNGLGGLFGGKNTSHPTGNQGIAGSPAADAGAAAGGGWFAGVINAATAAKAGSFMTANMGTLGMAFDMFLNQTNTGRALRDGTDVWQALLTGVAEKGVELAKNWEELPANWDPTNPNANVLARAAGNMSENADAAERLPSGADWRPSYMGGWSGSRIQNGKLIEETPEIIEDVDLDPLYTIAQKMEAVQDWWDAYRNADNGIDSYEEEKRAFEYMQEVLGDQFGDFWDTFLRESEGKDLRNLEDLPERFTESISGIGATLDDAVSEMRINVDNGKAVADKIAGADFKRFNNLPSEIQAAVLRGAASGVSGVQVRLDGYTVGRLIAPVVSNWIASYAQ